MAPGRPLALAWTAVNRTGLSGKTLGESEKLTMEESMRAITIDAAYAARLEDKIGSIDIGKNANFAVLAEHPYQVEKENPAALKDIEVVATVFNGVPIDVNKPSAGLTMSPSNLNKMMLISRYDGVHGGGDSCEASKIYQDVLSQM